MYSPKKIFGPIGSAVLSFIGYQKNRDLIAMYVKNKHKVFQAKKFIQKNLKISLKKLWSKWFSVPRSRQVALLKQGLDPQSSIFTSQFFPSNKRNV